MCSSDLDGGVYQVTGAFAANKNAKLMEFMGKHVEISGEVTKDKDGKLTIAADKVTLSK